jgi:hypothetical protein
MHCQAYGWSCLIGRLVGGGGRGPSTQSVQCSESMPAQMFEAANG